MDYKLDPNSISDMVSEESLEDFEKAQAIVTKIGEAYPALSINLLARLTMLCALQYDMSEHNMKDYIECLEKYMKISYTIKEELDVHSSSNKLLH
tara:strand:+ start:514 stop:798 length:285 start_codon:yes stop_codon:yes gene_type:complete